MSDAATLLALAARCEREESSYVLDRDIAMAIDNLRGFLPNYTSSLDAAVTLVPKEYKNSWSAGDNSGEDKVFGRLGYEHEATGLTPALALCAAALRARAALTHSSPPESAAARSDATHKA